MRFRISLMMMCTQYIQRYVMFVIDFRQVECFLRVLRFPPPTKLDCQDIAEILLKVALNTITLTL